MEMIRFVGLRSFEVQDTLRVSSPGHLPDPFPDSSTGYLLNLGEFTEMGSAYNCSRTGEPTQEG